MSDDWWMNKLLVKFAFFLLIEYSLILFQAQIEALKMLQGSIHPAKTPFLDVFRDFIDFHEHKVFYREAHLHD